MLMNSNRLDFKPMLGEFGTKDPYIFLEKLELSVARSQKKDLPHRVLFIFLLPGAFFLLIKIYMMARSQNQTGNFKNLIERSYLLIAISTVAYLTMWAYMPPLVTSFWNLFHQPNWEQFFSSLAQWETVQAIVLISIQLYFANLAIANSELQDSLIAQSQQLQQLQQQLTTLGDRTETLNRKQEEFAQTAIANTPAKKRVAIFIDGSNLYYALNKLNTRIDYTKLLKLLVGKDTLYRAIYYTGIDSSSNKEHGFVSWLSHIRIIAARKSRLRN